MRRFTYALCAVLLAMAVALGLIWLFQYRPFLANFLYSVAAEYWMPMDPPRYCKLVYNLVLLELNANYISLVCHEYPN